MQEVDGSSPFILTIQKYRSSFIYKGLRDFFTLFDLGPKSAVYVTFIHGYGRVTDRKSFDDDKIFEK